MNMNTHEPFASSSYTSKLSELKRTCYGLMQPGGFYLPAEPIAKMFADLFTAAEPLPHKQPELFYPQVIKTVAPLYKFIMHKLLTDPALVPIGFYALLVELFEHIPLSYMIKCEDMLSVAQSVMLSPKFGLYYPDYFVKIMDLVLVKYGEEFEFGKAFGEACAKKFTVWFGDTLTLFLTYTESMPEKLSPLVKYKLVFIAGKFCDLVTNYDNFGTLLKAVVKFLDGQIDFYAEAKFCDYNFLSLYIYELKNFAKICQTDDEYGCLVQSVRSILKFLEKQGFYSIKSMAKFNGKEVTKMTKLTEETKRLIAGLEKKDFVKEFDFAVALNNTLEMTSLVYDKATFDMLMATIQGFYGFFPTPAFY
jgi:hypothetical protein